MGMNVVVEVLIDRLNRHRKHLDVETSTLIALLTTPDEQPDDPQKEVLYRAEQKLRNDLGDEEYFRIT